MSLGWAGVVARWHGQGPAYVKATLCPGLGKGKEEKGDRRSEERRWGR